MERIRGLWELGYATSYPILSPLQSDDTNSYSLFYSFAYDTVVLTLDIGSSLIKQVSALVSGDWTKLLVLLVSLFASASASFYFHLLPHSQTALLTFLSVSDCTGDMTAQDYICVSGGVILATCNV